jgi:DNA-binding GntR family transcriptional regulator
MAVVEAITARDGPAAEAAMRGVVEAAARDAEAVLATEGS